MNPTSQRILAILSLSTFSVVLISGCTNKSTVGTASSTVSSSPIPSAVQAGKILGQVYYPQRIALPPETKLTVTLVDMTDSRKPNTMSTYSKTIGAQTPAPFELGFNPDAIKSTGTYEVFAQLELPDGKLWTHEQHFPVLTPPRYPAYVEIRVFPRR